MQEERAIGSGGVEGSGLCGYERSRVGWSRESLLYIIDII